MISITVQNNNLAEKKYVLEIVFGEFLGLEFNINVGGEELIGEWTIDLDNHSKLTFEDHFFSKFLNDTEYLEIEYLPTKIEFVKNNFTAEDDIPIVYGTNTLNISNHSPKTIQCGIDIFSSIFVMLSRLEEIFIEERDQYERVPATASIAFNNDFLDRPIVDEYVEMLWNMLAHLDPTLMRKNRIASNFITCDVDWPFDPIRYSLKKTVLSIGADLLKRKDIYSALNKLKCYSFNLLGLKQEDVYRDNLDWIMEVNEKAGNKVAFYFITHHTSKFDSLFNFDSKEMRALFQSIHLRGHEIGLHPGYECYQDAANFEKSAEILRKVLQEENICQLTLGGRMHFLRWDAKITPLLWEKNGFDYDSTLSYADNAGFRCGTCHEFSMFDLVNRKKLNIKQYPLVVMESTIIGSKYENLGYSFKSLERFKYFKAITKKYNGTFNLLWHNSYFEHKKDELFYKELIK